ncbi:unnamed protein product [Vitrella brassicaformis CCMP3155]|uniref:ABC transporter domain-containing protein n=1 Tax=Vitrella brassicaformis (strain CCMP3155) TaxID=1169540 RepID=A0A0G4FN10_VITBC|nr:unnamed protein product [Vitrella brassicaformis CCMP3155]|eukprot:CEM15570.1 unnamed protein product [Vitrella brassicaformis CCMP3155]
MRRGSSAYASTISPPDAAPTPPSSSSSSRSSSQRPDDSVHAHPLPAPPVAHDDEDNISSGLNETVEAFLDEEASASPRRVRISVHSSATDELTSPSSPSSPLKPGATLPAFPSPTASQSPRMHRRSVSAASIHVNTNVRQIRSPRQTDSSDDVDEPFERGINRILRSEADRRAPELLTRGMSRAILRGIIYSCNRVARRVWRTRRQQGAAGWKGSRPSVPAYDAVPVLGTQETLMEEGAWEGGVSGPPRLAVTFAFRSVSFAIPRRGKPPKQILHPVSGVFPAGSVVALMGPSGSGKSTLLDILAGKKKGGFEGSIYVNGVPRDKYFRRIAAYVPQDDILNPNETVREVLEFASSLTRTYEEQNGVSGVEQRQEDLMNLMAMLGLTDVADSRIGSTMMRGISGGQRRRVTLGKALVSDAALAFCDEPTSGLSAADSELVMQAIQNIAKVARVTFFVVIHQPRVEVFQRFDHVMLLAQGRVVFSGPPHAAAPYFEKKGFILPPHTNPADFFLDVLTPGRDGAAPDLLAQEFRDNEAAKMEKEVSQSIAGEMARHPRLSELLECLPRTTRDKRYVKSSLQQFAHLTRRGLTLALRDRETALTILCNCILTALLIGVTFWHVRIDRPVLYHLSAALMINMPIKLTALSNVSLLIEQRGQFFTESSDGWYSPLPHIAAQLLTSNILPLVGNTLLCVICWACLAFEWRHFPFFLLINLLGYLVSDACVNLAAVLSSNVPMAASLGGVMLGIPGIFNGFNANPRSMPRWLGWICYTSPFFYVFEGCVIELFNDYQFKVTDEFGSAEALYCFYGLAGRHSCNPVTPSQAALRLLLATQCPQVEASLPYSLASLNRTVADASLPMNATDFSNEAPLIDGGFNETTLSSGTGELLHNVTASLSGVMNTTATFAGQAAASFSGDVCGELVAMMARAVDVGKGGGGGMPAHVYKWVVDAAVLAGMWVVLRLLVAFYQSFFLRVKR